ncbi:uncharacterized protein LOC110044411 [Orbicella faveolata]|uniref:uncharacterized protein LOC110044411 n=1 Tax=Orbicella faveolata TaxID=48498 RepID=UPI0009E51BD1|nr:uncharacterized protein LOC110044411 [Orbicella faveolata]
MAAKQNGFLLFTGLLFLGGPYAYGHLPAKCKLPVGKAKTYSITDWTWKIVVDKLQKTYYINICGKVDHHGCNKDSSVCSTSTDDKNPKNMGSVALSSTTPTHGHFVLSPVSLASKDQDGGPWSSTIDIYDVTEK